MFHQFKKMLLIFVLATVGAGVFGCSKISGFLSSHVEDPKTVAEKFWNATKTGDPEKIKPFVTKASQTHEMMKEKKAEKTDGEFTLGEAKIEGEKATIPTTLKDKGFNIDLQTILAKEDGKWKVDAEKTMMTMFGGAMGDMMKQLGEAMGKALGEGVKGLGEGMKGMGEGLKKGMGEEMEKGEMVETETAEDEPVADSAPLPSDGEGTYSIDEKVLVEWHGTWYPSTVIELGTETTRIHYDGYSNSWDEWVGPERIRKK